MLLNPEQSRAARALLNWTREDLAGRSGVTVETIKNFENKKSHPHADTIEKILTTFDLSGVEFGQFSSVSFKANLITVFKGKEGYSDFLDDVYSVVKDGPSQAFVAGVDEKVFYKSRDPEFGKKHLDRMTSLKQNNDLDFRVLSKEGDDYFPGASYIDYRWTSEEYFYAVSFYVYGSKFAILLLDQEEPEIIVMNYPKISAAYKKQFLEMWEKAMVPPQLKTKIG